MSDTKSTRLTAAARRSRKAVATVATTDQGRAACTSSRDLFDRVELADGRTSYRDRLTAADICRGCPLATTCGFRIVASGRRQGSGR